MSESMNQTVFTPVSNDHDDTIHTTITNYSQSKKKKVDLEEKLVAVEERLFSFEITPYFNII